MTTAAGKTASSLLHRLWIYQRERIPLGRTALLLAVFSAASINISAQLAGRALPGWGSYAVAFAMALIFFFQLRACDEVKDAEDDRLYRPERPIPRGLVSLRLIVSLALAAVPVAAALTAVLDLRLLLPLTLVWLWMGLMTAEFFVPHWLKARPLLYVVSHMLIMPLIDLFITACEWLPATASPPAGLWLFLVLSSPRPGTYPGSVRVIDEATDKAVYFAHLAPHPQFEAGADTLAAAARMRCSFPRPGRYTVQVWFYHAQGGDVLKAELPVSVVPEGG